MNKIGNIVCHIDTANQLNNSWNRHSVVGIYAENDSLFYSIRISSSLKLKIRDKLKEHDSSHIVANLQAYIVYLILKNKEEYIQQRYIKRTWLCPDVKPATYYIKCIDKCLGKHGKADLKDMVNIKIKKHKEKSKAHPKVRKVYQKKKRTSYEFMKKDMELFLKYFYSLTDKKMKERSGLASEPR